MKKHSLLTMVLLMVALMRSGNAQTCRMTKRVEARSAPTHFVSSGAAKYAYRSYGMTSGTPLLLINRFRGTLDDWDPQLLDLLAVERQVIVFDNAGFAGSTGTPPETLQGLADDSFAFLKSLGIRHVDVLGFSYGGYTAELLAIDHPEVVNHLILASSGPGFVEGTATDASVIAIAGKPANSTDDLLYLFFGDSPRSRSAGLRYLDRTHARRGGLDPQVAPPAFMAQLHASQDIGTPETSLLRESARFTMPVLIAHGKSDRLIPVQRAYALYGVLSNAEITIYPDAGHGFLFQYPHQFVAQVLSFLKDE